MSDDELGGRLRAAVLREAGPAADDALADRLLHGAARRRRAGRAGAAAVTALALAGVAVGVGALLAGGDDTLSTGDRAGSPDGAARQTVREAGAVTVEQAARAGVDGTAACTSDAVAAPLPGGAGITPGLEPYAGYLTDARGYERWSREYDGQSTIFLDGPDASVVLALCWFAGDVPADLSIGRSPVPLTHQLVVFQVGGPAQTAGTRLDVRSPRPLPVLAPPAPADAPADAPLRTFPQPAGVAVVDELPLRPEPSPPVEPVDCTPTACADPSQEVIVAVETRVDGEPLDPRGDVELTPGETVTLQLTVEVEPGQTIRDLHFALTDGSVGSGPSGPIGIQELLLREPAVEGRRTSEVPWTVPALGQGQQLAVYYLDDKFETEVSHARTLGGVVAGDPDSGG